VYFDCENLTFEETITDPDVITEEDPTGDGWVGHSLDGRWDFPLGGRLDTIGDAVEEFLAENSCPYPYGPVVTPLTIIRSDIEIEETITVFGTLSIETGGGPIIGPM
jgi:hypothetical protein